MVYSSEDARVYHYALWYRILTIISWLFVGSLVALVAFTAWLSASASLEAGGAFPRAAGTVMLCLFSPLLAISALLLLELVAGIINAFTSYVKITPEGIEQKVFPFKHIRARWAGVTRVDQFGLYKAAYLREYEVVGLSLSYKTPLKYLNFAKTVMPLSIYAGWPGPLEADLRRYAGGVFVDLPAAPRTPGASERAAQPGTASTHYQDDRVVAAFAHASIFFLPVVIPLVVFLTQRGRSAYAAYHAMQALLFQCVNLLISMVLSVGLFLFIPAAALLARTGPELSADTLAGVLVAVLVASLLLIVLNVGFTVYALAGAVLSFLGKDFRYIAIASLAERWVR